MVRQISVLPAASTSQAPEGEEGADLADWLSRDLRAKGTPSRPPPTHEPPPPDPETAALVGWLARDLTPNHSVRPPVSAPPSEPPRLHQDAAPIAPVPIAAIEEATPTAPALDATAPALDVTAPALDVTAPALDATAP